VLGALTAPLSDVEAAATAFVRIDSEGRRGAYGDPIAKQVKAERDAAVRRSPVGPCRGGRAAEAARGRETAGSSTKSPRPPRATTRTTTRATAADDEDGETDDGE
jgi:hypothetical protein